MVASILAPFLSAGRDPSPWRCVLSPRWHWPWRWVRRWPWRASWPRGSVGGLVCPPIREVRVGSVGPIGGYRHGHVVVMYLVEPGGRAIQVELPHIRFLTIAMHVHTSIAVCCECNFQYLVATLFSWTYDTSWYVFAALLIKLLLALHVALIAHPVHAFDVCIVRIVFT